MNLRLCLASLLMAAALFIALVATPAPACCPAHPPGKPVVNADQTVIIIWDPESKTEHFIRQASFKSEADDFGFLIPTPAEPILDESGNEAFPYLAKITEPETIKVPRPSRGMSCGCDAGGYMSSKGTPAGIAEHVNVLSEKLVAGFKASVLETKSTTALVQWLKDHGYAFSPEVAQWAKPYVDQGWKITALKIAKDKDGKISQTVAASALRMSFKTDRPLFPYREPDPKNELTALNAHQRLLRIFFLGDRRYAGELTKDTPWTGTVAWANQITNENRQKLLEALRLPKDTGPKEWWLTEFEDYWPYRVAPADLYFSASADQGTVKRPPITVYVSSWYPTDASIYALAAVILWPVLVRRLRRYRA